MSKGVKLIMQTFELW